jgi:hypothetical protein
MFSNFIAYIKEIFAEPSYHHNLEAYITAGHPQDAADVDRLEREYYSKQRRQLTVFDKYY